MNTTEPNTTEPNTKDNPFASCGYKRSRKAYTAECMFEYLMTLLVTDAFLAKFLGSLGIDDSVVGIISSFYSLSFVIQFFSIFLYKWKTNAKRKVLFIYPISRILFSFLYLVPFFPIGDTAVRVTIMSFIIIAYACRCLIENVLFRWANSYVEGGKRASYSAAKEVISLASGILFTAVVGFFFDKFEAAGRINDGFIMLSVLAFMIAVLDIVCICLIQKEEQPVKQTNKSFSDVIKKTVGNPNFRPVILLNIIWDTARYFTIGFLGTYKTNDLMISVFVIQLINMIGNIARMIVSRPFGRFSDKRSFAVGMELALGIAAVSFFANMFAAPKTWYFIAIHTILYAVSMAGLNQNQANITYSYVDSDYITEAMAIKNSISGLCGFGASIVGSQILKYVQSNGNMLFGVQIYGQQLLSGISFVLTVAALLLTVLVIGKQSVMKQ